MKQNIRKKVGILGGSFDPIHWGHINIAKSAYEEYALDEVWFIPAGHSPNKKESAMTPALQRAEMTSLAIAEYPYFKLSTIEIDSAETSYTYRTLEKLSEKYPEIQFYFIMGADSLDYFEDWLHPEIICRHAILLVAVRDDMDIAEINKKIATIQALFPAKIIPIRGGRTAVSSTEIRKRAADNTPDISQCPKAVQKYIKTHGLYKEKKCLNI